jgi:polyphosphate kinase 2 (PPK2 family)
MKAKIAGTDAHKLKRRKYESELRKLQIRLCHLQDWVVSRGLRVIIIFEGRDAAGKGGLPNESIQGCFVSRRFRRPVNARRHCCLVSDTFSSSLPLVRS